jgi:hypothetical protein
MWRATSVFSMLHHLSCSAGFCQFRVSSPLRAIAAALARKAGFSFRCSVRRCTSSPGVFFSPTSDLTSFCSALLLGFNFFFFLAFDVAALFWVAGQ